MREFTRGFSAFPTRREFAEASRTDLRAAVDDFGGFDYWAWRLGLPVRPRQVASGPYSVRDAVAEAREVIAQLGYLPGARKLRQTGHGRLATEVQKTGGSRRFCLLHGLQ